MIESDRQHRAVLRNIAREAMIERGLSPDFSARAQRELSEINTPASAGADEIRDLRDLPWASIDNDDSLDLDQLTVGEMTGADAIRIYVAVADVEAVVRRGTAIDDHACRNTTSVYTAAMTFPMLPDKLSTNLTSLNANEDRIAIVVEMIIGADGTVEETGVYRAHVRSQAKLAYNSIAAWLDGAGPMPEAVAAVEGLEENLRLQDRVARMMKKHRHVHGALSLETVKTKPVFEGDEIRFFDLERGNRAKDIIENFMIAANGVIARYLSSQGFPSLRRVVRRPKKWERIVEMAAEVDFRLPDQPDSKMLDQFLLKQKAADPLKFPDLSLSVIKLMGPGEYVAEIPGESIPLGHFGLAIRDYGHSTAPNRRYPDLVTQRLVKAALVKVTAPYGTDELRSLASHCTEKEDAAKKVERRVEKSAAALLLQSRIGDRFDAIVTGAASKGTWVRLFDPPVEGRLVHGFAGVDVGHRVRVQLLDTDVERGYIDFKRVH